MQDSFDVTTIIFLALAVFVIWRLRSVLGQKTGAERAPFKPVDRSRTEPQARSEGDNVVRLPGSDRVQAAPPAAAAARDWRGIAEPGSEIAGTGSGLERPVIPDVDDAGTVLPAGDRSLEPRWVDFTVSCPDVVRTDRVDDNGGCHS